MAFVLFPKRTRPKAKQDISGVRLNHTPNPALFHPDFNRRLRNLTGSADPSYWKALAGFHVNDYRRWGITPRPENIPPMSGQLEIGKGKISRWQDALAEWQLCGRSGKDVGRAI
ncbi:hypothetical protein JI58_04740 [Marinosulfonomonas sp. PRT-SC04]|nr:hypothetical protein JI58_04740 [Marinosulfonomonas sp. PRT-SC04]